MAESREWTNWHLTPRGWEHGSWQTDFHAQVSLPPPEDRVLTYEHREEMSSPYSRMVVTDRELWRSGNEERVTSLLEQYGPPPKEIYVPGTDD